MSEVTQILDAIDAGEPHAADQLLPLVYDELRRLAAARLAHEQSGQTLDATALVHEAYLRLVGNEGPSGSAGGLRFANRRHFFASAAEAMRRILVENARRRASIKRGGEFERRELDESQLIAPETDDELLALDEALEELAGVDSVGAELVKLRYFAGLSGQRAAETLGLSSRTADRTWAYARAWLYQRLRRDSG
jgi:RNA polymerase sigma factor (TIGR02999 family)